jgi:hypothetical protein
LTEEDSGQLQNQNPAESGMALFFFIASFHGMSELVWRTGAFAGLFGDIHLQDTELEGGSLSLSLRAVSRLLSSLARSLSSASHDFNIFIESGNAQHLHSKLSFGSNSIYAFI